MAIENKIKFYQEFSLSFENMRKESFEPERKAGKTLVQKLLKKGYEVFTSNSICSGVPTSIIVGSDHIMPDCKSDFYKIASELFLPYRPGPFYIKR